MPLALVLKTLNDPLDSGESRQARLYRLLKVAVLSGRLAPGTRLPATRQLATDYHMARNTVLFAYQQLLAEGFLQADRGGTRVSALPSLPQATTQPISTAPPITRNLSQRARQLPRTAGGDAVLPFVLGVPDLHAFPWQAWSRELQRAWGEVSARQVASAVPGGEPELRQAVATFLSARRGVACTAAQVFIFPGGQTALDACARLLADSGDTVWLEEPGYTPARNAMLAAGLRTVAVPVDQDGMAADAALWRTAPPRLIYVTPSHQYPLGSVLSLERRLDLLNRLDNSYGWLIEDDYDSDFNHARPGAPLPAIQGLRPDAPVVYVGTFSKLLYPGLRIAYLVVPRWAVADIGEAIRSLYRGGQAVEQRALARFLDSGQLTRHVRHMAPIYRERQRILRAELHARFGAECEILGGQAGLHLVLRLPTDQPDTDLVDTARQRGVVARALSSYYSNADQRGNGLVLGYGMVEAAQIAERVRRLKG